jgi:hypothetical protein
MIAFILFMVFAVALVTYSFDLWDFRKIKRVLDREDERWWDNFDRQWQADLAAIDAKYDYDKDMLLEIVTLSAAYKDRLGLQPTTLLCSDVGLQRADRTCKYFHKLSSSYQNYLGAYTGPLDSSICGMSVRFSPQQEEDFMVRYNFDEVVA